MNWTLVVCETCGHVQFGRVDPTESSIALSTESASCGAYGGMSVRTYGDALDDN